MNPEKLTITPERGAEIRAMFNPERYTLSRGAQFAEVAVPGLDSPVLQFVRGQSEKITLDLFFDTTRNGLTGRVVDVRDETRKVYDLVKINRETHAPPRCTLTWGEGKKLFAFGNNLEGRCVVESVSEEFQLFSPSGVPLRAKLTVAFREYVTPEEQVRVTSKWSADHDKLVTVVRGQTLPQIAHQVYGDPREWRRIAEANDLDDPLAVTPGRRLLVPKEDGP